MSLYLKYRPLNFSDTVNQKHIIDVLKNQILNKSLNNNYLFYGSRWTWKTSVARILARAINCENVSDLWPCNSCNSCLSIINDKSIDFIEIDAASHTWVDNVREEIIEKSIYAPTSLSCKVYIIDEVHMLSKSAFNALLKIMEEPPKYLYFILATTELNKVPETIISRSQVFNFRKHTVSDIISRLEFISKSEWFTYEIEALNLIAKASDWAMRDAIKYLEQVSSFWVLNVSNVSNFLWIVWEDFLLEFSNSIYNSNLSWAISILEDLSSSWVNLSDFAKQMLDYCDNNFMSDPSFYTLLWNCLSVIIKEIRYFPNSLLLFKKEIYTFFPAINKIDNLSSIQWSDMNSDFKKIIWLIEKPSIKTALSRYSKLESTWNLSFNILVSSEIQYKILSTESSRNYLHSIFNNYFWDNVHLTISSWNI